LATKIQVRRDTSANWTSEDPVLAAGEFGFESDHGRFKLGDGTSAWSDLPYYETAPETIQSELPGSASGVVPALTFDAALFASAEVDYQLTADGEITRGKLTIVVDGAGDPTIENTKTLESADTLVTWTVANNSDDIEVTYTSTNPEDATLISRMTLFPLPE
jgi:hypothetical protein